MQLGIFIPGSVVGTSAAPMGSDAIPEGEKVQWIRILDMSIIGPSMIFGALAIKPPTYIRAGLMIAGAATILYNLTNFLKIQRQKALQARREQTYG